MAKRGNKKCSFRRQADDFLGGHAAPAANVLIDAIDAFEVTKAALANHFYVTVTFANLFNVPETCQGYGVVGRQTIGELAGKVALKLWLENQLFSPESCLDLYSEDGALRSQTSTLSEVLELSKDWGGDGVTLTFECVVRDYWLDGYDYQVVV